MVEPSERRVFFAALFFDLPAMAFTPRWVVRRAAGGKQTLERLAEMLGDQSE